jgi:periplasmic divalent cation tolerance protein
MSELCEVVITAPDPEWLLAFSRQLIQDRLCASAHNFAPVRSIYRWQGEIHERTEGRVSLHTSRSRVPEIIERAKREHPYEVPGVSTTWHGSRRRPCHASSDGTEWPRERPKRQLRCDPTADVRRMPPADVRQASWRIRRR